MTTVNPEILYSNDEDLNEQESLMDLYDRKAFDELLIMLESSPDLGELEEFITELLEIPQHVVDLSRENDVFLQAVANYIENSGEYDPIAPYEHLAAIAEVSPEIAREIGYITHLTDVDIFEDSLDMLDDETIAILRTL